MEYENTLPFPADVFTQHLGHFCAWKTIFRVSIASKLLGRLILSSRTSLIPFDFIRELYTGRRIAISSPSVLKLIPRIPNLREANFRQDSDLLDLSQKKSTAAWDILANQLDVLCIRVTLPKLVERIPMMTRLTELDVSISFEFLKRLTPHFPILRTLRVHFDNTMSFPMAEALTNIVETCPRLESVELSTSSELFPLGLDPAARYAPLQGLKNLKTVTFTRGEANSVKLDIHRALGKNTTLPALEEALQRMIPQTTAQFLLRLDGVEHSAFYYAAILFPDLLPAVIARFPPRDLGPEQLLSSLELLRKAGHSSFELIIEAGIDLYAPLSYRHWPRSCLLHAILSVEPSLLETIFFPDTKTVQYEGRLLSCLEFSRALRPGMRPSLWNSLWCSITCSTAGELSVTTALQLLISRSAEIISLTQDSEIVGGATTPNAWSQYPIDYADLDQSGTAIAEFLIARGATPGADMAARLIRYPKIIRRCVSNKPSLVHEVVSFSNQSLLLYVLKQYYSTSMTQFLETTLSMMEHVSRDSVPAVILDAIESIFSDFIRHEPSKDITESEPADLISLFSWLDDARLKRAAVLNMKLSHKMHVSGWSSTRLGECNTPALVVCHAICDVELESLRDSKQSSLLFCDDPNGIPITGLGLKLIQIACKSPKFADVLRVWTEKGISPLEALTEVAQSSPLVVEAAFATLLEMASFGTISASDVDSFKNQFIVKVESTSRDGAAFNLVEADWNA